MAFCSFDLDPVILMLKPDLDLHLCTENEVPSG